MRSSQVCPSIVRIGHLYILHHHHPIYPYDDDTSPLTIPSSYPVSVPSTTSNHLHHHPPPVSILPIPSSTSTSKTLCLVKVMTVVPNPIPISPVSIVISSSSTCPCLLSQLHTGPVAVVSLRIEQEGRGNPLLPLQSFPILVVLLLMAVLPSFPLLVPVLLLLPVFLLVVPLLVLILGPFLLLSLLLATVLPPGYLCDQSWQSLVCLNQFCSPARCLR